VKLYVKIVVSSFKRIIQLIEVKFNGDELAQNIKDRIVKELDWAFTHVGFVYLKNHGVQQLLVSHHVFHLYLPIILTNYFLNRLIIFSKAPNRFFIYPKMSRPDTNATRSNAMAILGKTKKCYSFLFDSLSILRTLNMLFEHK